MSSPSIDILRLEGSSSQMLPKLLEQGLFVCHGFCCCLLYIFSDTVRCMEGQILAIISIIPAYKRLIIVHHLNCKLRFGQNSGLMPQAIS